MKRCSTTLWLIRTIRIFGSIILLRRMMPCFASPMVSAWITTTSRQTFVRRTARRWANSLSSVPNDKAGSHDGNSRVAIVGGGLAGLATCHAWLSKIQNISATPLSSTRNWTITIYDTHDRPGIGGASALAGGLIHPLSPRGKLVYRGLEGLEASNRLIDAACQATALEESTSSSSIILSDTIWRVAQNPKHVQQLQETAERFPEFGTWIDSPLHLPESTLGALKLTNGCRVIHVPSYLQGLWKHCQEMAHNCQVSLQWNQLPSSEFSSSSDNTSKTLQSELESFDTVILSAGSAIFQDYLPSPEPEHKDQIHVFPIHLVRGQSIEFQRQSPSDNEEENDIPDSSSSSSFSDALLCGKYISPLPGPPGHRVLVGATHEFQKEAASSETVLDDMQRATEFMAPELWQESGEYRVDRMTLGYRVQSQRGAHGRLPLIGKLTLPQFLPNHENTWIYTGLSSRGLLYHALFADILVDAAWCKNEALLEEKYPELQWWKKDG